MKPRIALVSLISLGLLLGGVTTASAHQVRNDVRSESIWIGSFGPRLHNWRAISRNELIIWASPSRPYLVTTRFSNSRLRFAHTIGVTTTVGRITKFDSIIVDGWRMPIASIVALDRETAKSMRWTKTRK